MRQAAIAVLALVACSGTLTHFDHRAHLAEHACGGPGQSACLSCASCHVEQPQSHDTFAPLGAGACVGCHRDADAKLQHAMHGPLAVAPVSKAIVFSHDAHLEMSEIKGQCVKCHAGAVGFQDGPPLFPPMATCTSCHRHQQQFENGECFGCHRLSDLRQLKPVSFLSHDLAWMRRHGDAARSFGSQCTTCHAQTQCDSCHDTTRRLVPAQVNPELIDRALVHRFDFVSRHAIEAESAPGSCFSCHVNTECESCHASRGVSPAVRGAQSPHPKGWASGTRLDSHGPAARRDIASCAACHDQGPLSNCISCHKVGGSGGNPHPRGFRSNAPITSPQCAVCHGAMP
jgi:hypothetical protein